MKVLVSFWVKDDSWEGGPPVYRIMPRGDLVRRARGWRNVTSDFLVFFPSRTGGPWTAAGGNFNGRIWIGRGGVLHRVGGPALEWNDGSKSWFVDGVCRKMDSE